MSLFIFRSKNMPHVRGLLRAAGYLAVTSLAFTAYSVKVARAEARNRTLEIGREMAGFAQGQSHDVTPMVINGETMYLGSSVSDDAPDAILDRYETSCKQNPGQPALGWADVKGKVDKTHEVPEIMSGAMRAGTGQEGSVVCFLRGENTKASFQEAFKSFMSTGELGALGKFRYVYAKKNPKSGHTLVLTAWTDDKFNLNDLMPEEGKDVAGSDFPEIPRVPNSFRALSAVSKGLPYGLNVYKTTDAPGTTLKFYDSEMVKAGWRGYNPELDPAAGNGEGRAYVKNGVVLTVTASVLPEGNFASLGLAGITADAAAPTPTVSR